MGSCPRSFWSGATTFITEKITHFNHSVSTIFPRILSNYVIHLLIDKLKRTNSSFQFSKRTGGIINEVIKKRLALRQRFTFLSTDWSNSFNRTLKRSSHKNSLEPCFTVLQVVYDSAKRSFLNSGFLNVYYKFLSISRWVCLGFKHRKVNLRGKNKTEVS